MATELSLISANRRPSASVGGAMTSWTTPPVDTQRTVGALGWGEALAGLLWRSHSWGQGGRYTNTLSRQSQR